MTGHGGAQRHRLGTWALLALLTITLAASVVIALAFGAQPLPLTTVIDVILRPPHPGSDEAARLIVWDIRLPRVLLGALVGAGLAIAGTAVQTLVRNPLADPYLLGISSGASVGATLAIATGLLAALGSAALSVGALTGALLAATAVFGIALAQGGLTPLRLILTGTVMSAAFSSAASFLVFVSADPQATQSVLFWLLGSLGGARWDTLALPATVVAIVGIGLWLIGRWLDALASGATTAATVGVPVRPLRVLLFTAQAVLVGVLVAVSGGIGFVGLIVPHIARLLVGGRHHVVLPVAALAGALFLVWVDVLARIVVRPIEIPLSVVTGLIGAPVFLVLLGRRTYRFGGES